ncbi:hypothetical protein COY95_00015 [Candidatus Woesearchaeota archaeon CG_4_10_14_0_8_um_filter_47_5]|nr:MAG: hypothetical protein COY95_00015 [Candidatus Woesearchaeota archaeon CG_4_10_14_0_8_um_filter_47_5]
MILLPEKNIYVVLILEALSQNYPLSSIKLYRLLREQYAYGGSYQSLYRTLQQMAEAKILTKDEREYCINPHWVKEMKQKLEQYDITINGGKQQRPSLSLPLHPSEPISLPDSLIQAVDFTTIKDLMHFVKSNEEHYTGAILIKHVKHSIPFLVDSLQEQRIHITLHRRNITHHILCEGNTPLDQQAQKLYQQIGTAYHLSNQCLFSHEAIIFDDTFFQIYMHPAWIVFVEKCFREAPSLNHFDYNEFSRHYESSSYPSTLLINRTKEIVDKVKEQSLMLCR